jgi:hypothetical protein
MESSDDDMPIAALISRAAAAKKPSSAPAAMNIPKQAVAAPVVKSEAVGKKPSAGAIDSDDDDVPLAVLMKRKLEAAQKTANVPNSKIIKTAPPAKKMKVDEGLKNPSRKVNDKKLKGKKKKVVSRSAVVIPAQSSSSSSRSSVHYDSDKGKVVQALMIRWWYAMQWPDVGDLKKRLPTGYEALDGFSGVFVGTRVNSLISFILVSSLFIYILYYYLTFVDVTFSVCI